MRFPILIEVHRSRWMPACLAGIVVSGLAVVLVYPGSRLDQAIFSLILLLTAALAWRHLARIPFRFLRLQADGSISLCREATAAGRTADLLPGAFVHPLLTVFRVTLPDERPVGFVLAVDSAGGEDLRRLRVFLRWRAGVTSVSAPDGDA